MVVLTCAVGRVRLPAIADQVRFDFTAAGRPGGLCPTCLMPVVLVAGDEHVSVGRPPTATLCCPTCGGLAHRGPRADPRMAT
jgi:hypothetical protein